MRFASISAYFQGYFVWLGLFFLIVYLWKLSGGLWLSGISDHLSNFALTGIGSLVFIGPAAFGVRRGYVRVLGVSGFFIVANITVELLAGGTLGGFNVLDGYDALYGILASGIVVAAHILTTRRRAVM